MKTLIQAIAVTGAVTGGAVPALAQEASQEVGARLDALTCSEFLALDAQDQMTVMLAMRAHASGDPLPDEPLPIGLEAEIGGADGLGGDSGGADADGLEVGAEGTTDAAAGEGEAADAGGGTDAPAGEATGAGDADAAGGEATAEAGDADAAGGEAAGAGEADAAGGEAGGGEGADGTDPPDETGIVDGENESGKVNPDGTEMSVTDEPGDPKLTAMRTSCEGGPESLAADAMRAAHADYE